MNIRCECGREAKVRGHCKACYERLRRNGKLTLLPERLANARAVRLTPAERWARVVQHIDADGDCWLWMGVLDKDGYGIYGNWRAHRLVHELLVGPIPEGLTSDHLCRVRNCVNTDHIEFVTVAENNRRRYIPKRAHPRSAACGKGHPFSPENTYQANQGRQCRACNRAAVARYKARKAGRADTAVRLEHAASSSPDTPEVDHV